MGYSHGRELRSTALNREEDMIVFILDEHRLPEEGELSNMGYLPYNHLPNLVLRESRGESQLAVTLSQTKSDTAPRNSVRRIVTTLPVVTKQKRTPKVLRHITFDPSKVS